MVRQAHQRDYLKVRNQKLPSTLLSFLLKKTFSLHSSDNDKRPDSISLDRKETELDNKHRNSVEIKQERLNDVLCSEDDFLSSTQPPLKKLRADVADAESNTTNSGKLKLFFYYSKRVEKSIKTDKIASKPRWIAMMSSRWIFNCSFLFVKSLECACNHVKGWMSRQKVSFLIISCFQALNETFLLVNGHHQHHMQLKIHFGIFAWSKFRLWAWIKWMTKNVPFLRTTKAVACVRLRWKFPYHHICLWGNKKMITREMAHQSTSSVVRGRKERKEYTISEPCKYT